MLDQPIDPRKKLKSITITIYSLLNNGRHVRARGLVIEKLRSVEWKNAVIDSGKINLKWLQMNYILFIFFSFISWIMHLFAPTCYFNELWIVAPLNAFAVKTYVMKLKILIWFDLIIGEIFFLFDNQNISLIIKRRKKKKKQSVMRQNMHFLLSFLSWFVGTFDQRGSQIVLLVQLLSNWLKHVCS